MPTWRVPLADVVVTEDDIAVVSDVYRSGWLSMGPCTEELESELAAYVGARHAIAVSSGTAALHLICLAAGLGPGDEVIVPSMTFVATVNAVAYTGARPVFADIESLACPWLSAAAVARAITPRTRAVLTMSYGGHPGAVQDLSRLCDARGLLLLEDAAHGLGTRVQGRHVGTFGAAGAFSFFSNKNLCVGEGGAVVSDDGAFAERVRLLRSHGMTSLSWDRHRGHATKYDVVALGFNYRIDEPRAALATARLRRLDEDNDRRRALDLRYRAELDDATICALPQSSSIRACHHLFCIVLDPGIDRDDLRAHLATAGIQTSVHYPAVHRFSIYEERNDAQLPLSESYSDQTVTLPLFAHLDEHHQTIVIDGVRATLQRAPAVRSA